MKLCRLFVAATLALPCASHAGESFNPDISLILSGTYGQLQHDPANYLLPGFPLAEETGPGERGFSLGESELVLSANIDPDWYGMLTLALGGDGTSSVENAYVQTTSLGHGVTGRAGRFFSGIGYLNEQHAHTWDFVDAALPYRALLGNQYQDDGVQLRWVAPTALFTELGGEWLNGANFPAGGSANGGRGAWSAFVHLGDDVGESHSWRAGLSWLATKAVERLTPSAAGDDLFSGNSQLLVADFVWKWAPQGNNYERNFKLQGEYLHNQSEGDFTPAGGLAAPYSGNSSGWYLQGIYQLIHGWRVGLRHDQLKTDTPDAAFTGTVLDTQGHTPTRNSVMVDYANSEFSRLRLQYNRDESSLVTDHQWFLQYQMSLGAHGAHSF
ncbi:MAG TPA: hypothetical protein VGE50_11180 [Gammaproteobacteria bacterium]